jgi:CRP-like cAMP-binding protein
MIAIMSRHILDQLDALPCRHRFIAEGEYLFHRGDPVAALYIVRSGELRLLRDQPEGRSLVLQRAGAHQLLAEASMFASHYHCSAVAACDSTVAAIPVERVRTRLRDDPATAGAWAAYLAGEVQQARFRSEVLSLKGVAERLDAWLAWHETGLPPRGEWHVLAREIGVSPEALYRELARRRRHGKRP